MENKKFKGSPLSLVFYGLSILMVVYMIFQIFASIEYLNQAFASYQTSLSQNIGDAFKYILGSAITPLVNACVLFGVGVAIKEARKANPDNYVIVEDLADFDEELEDIVEDVEEVAEPTEVSEEADEELKKTENKKAE